MCSFTLLLTRTHMHTPSLHMRSKAFNHFSVLALFSPSLVSLCPCLCRLHSQFGSSVWVFAASAAARLQLLSLPRTRVHSSLSTFLVFVCHFFVHPSYLYWTHYASVPHSFAISIEWHCRLHTDGTHCISLWTWNRTSLAHSIDTVSASLYSNSTHCECKQRRRKVCGSWFEMASSFNKITCILCSTKGVRAIADYLFLLLLLLFLITFPFR